MRELYEDYAGRIAAGGPFQSLDLREVEAKGNHSGDVLKQREASLLREALPQGCYRIALDEGGKELTSQALAEKLGRLRDEGWRSCGFIIGGADGLDGDLLQEVDFKLCLGRMTWPHMVVRALLAEQLYRAGSILIGHPYHRE